MQGFKFLWCCVPFVFHFVVVSLCFLVRCGWESIQKNRLQISGAGGRIVRTFFKTKRSRSCEELVRARIETTQEEVFTSSDEEELRRGRKKERPYSGFHQTW